VKSVRLFLLALLLLGVVGCSVNPVTGKRQLNFYSEEDEIALGAQADPVIVAHYGLLDDEQVQDYVKDIGQRMVPVSHRPNLKFHFKVLDDPIVNAFALPGGYVYITRGILAYLDNEAALAGVVGHEIGHVTAQHGVTKMSGQSVLGLGLALGSAVASDIPFIGDIAGTSAQLLFLKYGRDDERQSDELGVQYATALGYDTTQMAEFFHSLDRLSPENGGLPGWMSTHPDPGDRWVTVRELTAKAQQTKAGPFETDRDRYLDRVDGLVFGTNPREGYFSADAFHHPDLHFRFPVPDGWTGQNTRAAVGLFAPESDAVIILGGVDGSSARAAASTWVGREGVKNLGQQDVKMAGDRGVRTQVRITTDEGVLRVVSSFFKRDGTVWVMHGYAAEADFAQHESTFIAVMNGFAEETDPEVLAVRPVRLRIVAAPRNESFTAFAARYPIPEGAMIDSVQGLAILNGVEIDDAVAAGRRIKVLVRTTP